MTNHLATCREEHIPSERETVQLMIEGRYRPDFWAHLDIDSEATLADLDTFLRKLWLEPCCGHMSAFTIGEERYSIRPMDTLDERDMDVPLQQVITDGTEFTHEYDFGTTTELAGRVPSTEMGAPEDDTSGHGPDAIQLLHRMSCRTSAAGSAEHQRLSCVVFIITNRMDGSVMTVPKITSAIKRCSFQW